MRINRTNIAEHLVEYQLDMIGKSMSEAYKTPDWRSKWTITTEQFNKLKTYAIPLFKKVFKCNRSKAEDIFGWFNMQFGLRIDDDNLLYEEPEKL